MGSEASKEIGDRFTQLESDVDAKQEAVVDTLATKYVEARKGLDERIEALQAENKGLVDKAIGAIKAVINTIRELVSMLTGVLARAAGVIGDIVKAPIKFLGNLIAGVKGGILKFKDNILDHLRKGLMSWLFGALAEAGVELPDKFDLMGIVKLLASIFGLTWTNIRNRIVKQVGEKAMAAIEKGVEIFSVLRTQGVAGLWQMLLEKLGDIKEMILEQVKDFVITKIITAGITWLIGLLNPAAAFIKACKMIYDIVMFFVDNGSRILKFVNTVIDSVADIVKGNVSGVVNKINDVLGQMVPIIIGFLASLVGLGGIGQKIRSIVETLQKPVTKALDFVIKTGLKLAGPIIRGIKGISGKVKAKVAAGKAWVKGKLQGGDDSPEGKQKRLDKGMAAALAAVNRFAGRTVGEKLLKPLLAVVRVKYGLTSLTVVDEGGRWTVVGVVNPGRRSASSAGSTAGLDALRKAQQSCRNRIKKDLKAAWNNNSVKTRLSADPALRKTLGNEFDRLTTAMGGKTEQAYDDLIAGRPSKASVPKLVDVYRLHRDAADLLIQRLDDLTKSPAQLADEATKARTELTDSRAAAVAILAKAPVAQVLALASFSDLKGRLTTRQKHVDTAVAAVASRSLEQLRQDVATAKKFLADARTAEGLTDVADAIKPSIASIDDICRNTTKEGKDGADVGDGSSEAAAMEEVRTGKSVKGRAHGPKCAMEARGLRKEIAKLTDLQKQTTDPGIVKQITDAITKATNRANALESGAEAWQKRVATDPKGKIWNLNGESKVEPGFGKGI